MFIRAAAIGFLYVAFLCRPSALSAGEGVASPKSSEDTDVTGDKTSAGKTQELERDFTMKTLGGRQFWGDLVFFHQWRIQRNVLTGKYRLLDGDDYQHAGGTIEDCRKKLEEIKQSQNIPPMKGRGVILVHGIFRSSKSMTKIRQAVQEEGCEVFGFDYPSTRVTIADSAEYLHETIKSLEGIDDIQFVVHSMGGLVVRAYLDKYRDPRISRMVMIGVPNLGAELADLLKKNLLFKALYGPAGQQLISAPEGFIAKLPTPDFEFGILAGARGTLKGYNILLDGDDDGTVTVACTRLPGATDFVTVPCLHSFLVLNADAAAYTKRFLKEGRFREEGERHAIPREQLSPMTDAAATAAPSK